MPPDVEPIRRTLKVFLVEDNEHLVGLFRRLMARTPALDIDLHTATNGLDALARLAADRFDAVIVDMYLPKLDGAAVIRRARDELRLVDVPFIVVSAGGAPARVAAMAAGATIFFDKPIRIQELTDALLGLCER